MGKGKITTHISLNQKAKMFLELACQMLSQQSSVQSLGFCRFSVLHRSASPSEAAHLPSHDVKSRTLTGVLIVVRKEGHSQLAWAHSSTCDITKAVYIMHGRLEAFPLGKRRKDAGRYP